MKNFKIVNSKNFGKISRQNFKTIISSKRKVQIPYLQHQILQQRQQQKQDTTNTNTKHKIPRYQVSSSGSSWIEKSNFLIYFTFQFDHNTCIPIHMFPNTHYKSMRTEEYWWINYYYYYYYYNYYFYYYFC